MDKSADRAMEDWKKNREAQRRTRSSIACTKCRRSKIKCVNNGIQSTCRACAASGGDCQYQLSGSSSVSKRSKITTNITQENNNSAKIVRTIEDGGRTNSTWAEDPLESAVLTRKVWNEVYDIFKLHFSTEMPFLHPPTFRKRMHQVSYPRDPSVALTSLQGGRSLLLAVLMLTARFHSELVAYRSSTAESSNPIDASEYYATYLKTALDPLSSNLTNPSIDKVQALLMLALYEWGQTRGTSALVYSGAAIRLALAIGLAHEDDNENHSCRPSSLPKDRSNVHGNATEMEVRRRTLWSCFIMDRMMSGKYEPTIISVKHLEVQLPCSDDQFLFARDVMTDFLNKPARADKIVNNDGVLGRYIRLIEIFGRVLEWSCTGGRRTEALPPWDSSTQFFKLLQELGNFGNTLPSNLILTEANLSAYIEKRNATTYASMHVLYSLCLIMLHREYVPFLPHLCAKLQGPLDNPVLPENLYHTPGVFLEESAEAIFKAARDIVNIVQTCQDSNALPESPQVGFAVWQAGFVCLYAARFPHMDVSGYVHLRSGQSNDDHRPEDYMRLTVSILQKIVPRLEIAKGYLDMLKKIQNYFSNLKINVESLEDFKTLEKELKEFGRLHETDEIVTSDSFDSVVQACSRATKDNGNGSVNGDAMRGEAAPECRAWATINSECLASENDDQKFGPSHHNTNHQKFSTRNSTSLNLVDPGRVTHAPGQSYLNSGESSYFDNVSQPDYAETQFDDLVTGVQDFENRNYDVYDPWGDPTVTTRQGGF